MITFDYYVLFLVLNIRILSIIVIQDLWTALIVASMYGHLPVVEYLVQQGAAINIQSKVRNNNYILLL